MLPKDLLIDLERGNRIKEFLKDDLPYTYNNVMNVQTVNWLPLQSGINQIGNNSSSLAQAVGAGLGSFLGGRL